MEQTDFPIEFYNATGRETERLQDEAETRLRKLARGHTDIVSASVKITQPSANRDNVYEVTITLHMRPDDLAATEQGAVAQSTLKQALDQIERQARDKRERLRGY